ncbi:MAG: hypothetical protein A3I61_10085 [Acidobacteria bacterium RIFCSPLOWO2_02_FULL_68_18]|nr:MAG: hypothetical protein A3I61_10085 [Acidobacteria bacterium RIFCSPLOWO2_02_FULL_68_18]
MACAAATSPRQADAELTSSSNGAVRSPTRAVVTCIQRLSMPCVRLNAMSARCAAGSCSSAADDHTHMPRVSVPSAGAAGKRRVAHPSANAAPAAQASTARVRPVMPAPRAG